MKILCQLIYCILFIVMPLRNAHYYDALDALETQVPHILSMSGSNYENSMQDIIKEIRDRCVAVDVVTRANVDAHPNPIYICLRCGRDLPSPMQYIFHECGDRDH